MDADDRNEIGTGDRLSHEWRRASRCSSGTCVEAKRVGDQISLRNSKQPDGATIVYSREEWRTFVDAVKAGEFDVE